MNFLPPPQDQIVDQSGVMARIWGDWLYSIFTVLAGKLDAPYTVTLAANAASTVVPNKFCNTASQVILTPTTAHAAASTGVYIVHGRQTFTIFHNNTADTDKTFRYAIVG